MKKWIDRALKRGRDRSGSAMLEFAIGSAVLVSAFTGTFQFGYSFLQYNNLENAVERGAKYASVATYDSATSTPSTAFQTAVQNMVLYGSATAPSGANPVLPGLTASNVNFTVAFSNGVPATMTVSITGYTINSVFAQTTLTNKPQVSYAYQGIWQPI